MRPLAILIGLGLSSNAFALSCMWGVTGTNVQPDDELPTNARILVEHTFDDTAAIELELRDEAGASVPFTVDPGHNHAYLLPERELAPGAYTLAAVGDDSFLPEVGFTVGSQADTERPEAPTIDLLDRMFDPTEWGDVAGIRVVVGEVFDAAHYEYEIATEADFTDAHRVASTSPELTLGRRLCDAPFPDYERSERYHVRVRAIDLAGNPSEWTTSDGEVRGCSTTGSAGWLLGFPVGLLIALRKRRR